MAIKLEDKTRVEAPGVDYPYGQIKDSTPTVKGTPVNVEVYGDFHQYFARLLAESGIQRTICRTILPTDFSISKHLSTP